MSTTESAANAMRTRPHDMQSDLKPTSTFSSEPVYSHSDSHFSTVPLPPDAVGPGETDPPEGEVRISKPPVEARGKGKGTFSYHKQDPTEVRAIDRWASGEHRSVPREPVAGEPFQTKVQRMCDTGVEKAAQGTQLLESKFQKTGEMIKHASDDTVQSWKEKTDETKAKHSALV